jgi:ClpP class serine protease
MTEGSSSFFVKKEPKKLLDLVGGWIAGVWKQAPRVPVIRFTGIIAARAGSINLEGYAPLIDKAIAHAKKPKHLILAIESPGGSAAQSDLIGQYIRRKAVEKNIEITAVIGDVGASGGYWLACAADNIYANRLSIVGSIGVITGGFGFDRFIGRYEIERRLSTAGQNKARLDPFSPRDAADNAFIQVRRTCAGAGAARRSERHRHPGETHRRQTRPRHHHQTQTIEKPAAPDHPHRR